MISKIKYYTFQDVVDFLSDNYPISQVTYPSYPHQSDASSDWFSKALDEVNLKFSIIGVKANSTIITADTIKGYINDLIMCVYNRHRNDFIVSQEKYIWDESDFDEEAACMSALEKLLSVINLTAPKYIPLMYQYVQNYEDPIKMLESISESMNRYNDTPQNEQDEVDYNTPAYATNMGKAKNVSKVDSGSVLDRLEALKDKFRSIILDWSNEFNQEFIADIQIGD